MEHGNGLGVAITMWAPANLSYVRPDGSEVSVEVVTDYPFDEKATVLAFCGTGMVLSLRIPSWTYDPVISINGTDVTSRDAPVPGTMHEIICTWKTEVELTFPMKVVVTRRYNNASSVYRG